MPHCKRILHLAVLRTEGKIKLLLFCISKYRSMITMNICTALRCCILLSLIRFEEQVHGFTLVSTRTSTTWLRHENIRLPEFVEPSLLRRQLSADPTIVEIVMDDDDDENASAKESDVVMEDEDEDDDNDSIDPYMQTASSEFNNNASNISTSGATDLVFSNEISTSVDWGGALGKLRQRFDDIEQGKSGNPSQALFRLMSAQSPNQAIGSFVNSASPQVVQAMSGAVSSLLGGLSSPTSGIETIVKATGSKIGTLCFQLQMTG